MLVGSLFRSVSVLVVGDFLLDTYTTGKVRRISPEAPVPVLEVEDVRSLPGGAGNVVLNLASLGASVFAAGRIGADSDGSTLLSSLMRDRVDLSALLSINYPKTSVKNRLVAHGQQLLRVDDEVIVPLSCSLEEDLFARISLLIPQVNIVALSDYGKGVVTPRLSERVIEQCRECGVPIVVDPKGRDFSKYRNATMIKPNLKEAYEAAHLSYDEPLELVAERLLVLGIDQLLVTRSEEGITLFERGGKRKDFPVHRREVKDGTGAGDTVLAVLCVALGAGMDLETAIHLANGAAGLVIERMGCAQVTPEELSRAVESLQKT